MSWSSLEKLEMAYSENLKEFPYVLDSITDLHLRDTEIQEISPWVKRCSRLSHFVIKNMQKLVSVSELPDSLEFLDAEGCESLERLDCSFSNPDVRLNFGKCFKLNQEARNLIIQTPTYKLVVLPGGEVPAYFTFRSSGKSVIVKLNEKPPLPTSTKFRACIVLATESEFWKGIGLECRITSQGEDICGSRQYFQGPIFSEHLYLFDVQGKDKTSTELEFVFELNTYGNSRNNIWIKECGIRQLSELQTKTSETGEC